MLFFASQKEKKLTNEQIETEMLALTQQERKITKRILELINLSEERKLFLERGYPTMVDWLVKVYGYSERAAFRRISAARLLKTNPQISQKLEAGAVNLTTLSQVQSAIRAQEKATGQTVSAATKMRVIDGIENKSSLETERTLLAFFLETALQVKQDRVSRVDSQNSRLSINLSNDTLKDLNRVRELLSHSMPGANWADIFQHLVSEFLKRNDPLRNQSSSVPRKSTAHAQGVSAAVRRLVLQHSRASCDYVDPISKRRCGSTFQIEIDHIRPKAFGGGDEPENLRCLCRKHNQLMAERNLGHQKANEWRRCGPVG